MPVAVALGRPKQEDQDFDARTGEIAPDPYGGTRKPISADCLLTYACVCTPPTQNKKYTIKYLKNGDAFT